MNGKILSMPLVVFMSVLVLATFLHGIEGSLGSESVPVLMWSPEKRMSDFADAHSADILGSDVFHKTYLTPLMKDASVIFLQDKLHTDDFIQYADVYSLDSTGGAFANIKNLMEENFSLEMPQVSHPLAALKKLMVDFEARTHTVSSLSEIEGLNLQPSAPSFLLIVRLQPTSGSQDREAVIQTNDKMIGDVCDHLTKRSIKYTAAFTGESPSESMAMEGEVHSSRHLMADEPVEAGKPNGTIFNISGSGLLYMKDIDICVSTPDASCKYSFKIFPTEGDGNTSVIVNNTANVQLVFNKRRMNNGTDEYDIKIVQIAEHQVDRWVIKSTNLYFANSGQLPTANSPSIENGANSSSIENGPLSPADMDFIIPIMYSYHCTAMRMYIDSLNPNLTKFSGTYVQFNRYQFQPFNVQNGLFFNAMDCVGFFTTAILMGLFPVAILLIILIFGTLMLLNLSIMDRYDDPKGKTIIVHSATE